jgi:hypothetical protein
MYWNFLVIVLCLLLVAILIWREVKRRNKLWLAARIIASVLSIISLACLALPITIPHTLKETNSASSILITEGYDDDSIRRILHDNPGAKVYTTDKNIKYSKATYTPDVNTINSDNSAPIHIVGFGLRESELNLLKKSSILLHPSNIKNAITSVTWRQKIVLGGPFIVQGRFNNTASSPVKIVLSGFNTNLDSTTIAANKASNFQLTTIPKHLDKAVYNITVLSSTDTLENEPVPIEVNSTQPLSILMLASSPDFENKFLKNWLSANRYKLVVRTTITQNKYDKEYLNMSPISSDRITPSLLNNFDVIIADASTLKSLPASDLATVKNYIDNKGVGLIVKADTLIASSAFYSRSFPLIETRDSIGHVVKLNVNDTGLTSTLKIEQPLYIRTVAGTQPLIKDQQSRVVASSKLQGSGKVILTTVNNSFSWQLAGNTQDYSSYWTLLLTQAAKKVPLEEVWSVSPSISQVDQEVHLKLQITKPGIPQVQAGADVVPMEQHPFLPYKWTGTYWPQKTGWKPLINQQGATTWWYVYDKNDWKGVIATDKIRATKRYAADHPFNSTELSISTTKTTTEIPKTYFFILFAISAGFLWFEKKFNNK